MYTRWIRYNLMYNKKNQHKNSLIYANVNNKELFKSPYNEYISEGPRSWISEHDSDYNSWRSST